MRQILAQVGDMLAQARYIFAQVRHSSAQQGHKLAHVRHIRRLICSDETHIGPGRSYCISSGQTHTVLVQERQIVA